MICSSLGKFACVTATLLLVPVATLAATVPPEGRPTAGVDPLYDVAVIGGGASGAYAAARLQEEGKKVALIERQGYLGGNAATYTDPKSGIPVELGARQFVNRPIITDFFRKFGVALGPDRPQPNSTAKYIDFRRGEAVNVTRGGRQAFIAALRRYDEQLKRYPELVTLADLPDPIPDDLLLSLGDFVQKYQLEDLITNLVLLLQGFGDFLKLPTLNFMVYVDQSLVTSILSGNGTALASAQGDSSLLYKAIGARLGDDVMLNTIVDKLKRPKEKTKDGVITLELTTVEYNEDGKWKKKKPKRRIRARKVLSAFPQTAGNFRGWDLDDDEESVFGRRIGRKLVDGGFDFSSFSIGLLRNSQFPGQLTLNGASKDNQYNLIDLPGVYTIRPSFDPSLPIFYWGASGASTNQDAKKGIFEALDKLRKKDIIPDGGENNLATIVSHGPYALHVSSDEAKKGFYKKLYSLQGYRNTYYTGAALSKHSTPGVWEYTEELLTTQLLKDLA